MTFTMLINIKMPTSGARGVLGIWGEWLFPFRKLGSTGNCFVGSGEQAHSFLWIFREPYQKVKNKLKKTRLKGKAYILFDFLIILFSSGG